MAGGRVPHALLFYGRDGVGKRAAALELAKTLQCERGAGEACGRCLACTKVGRLLHPDVHVLLPAPKDADTDDLRARLETLAKNPYATVDFVRRPSLDDPAKTSNKQAFYPVARNQRRAPAGDELPSGRGPVQGRRDDRRGPAAHRSRQRLFSSCSKSRLRRRSLFSSPAARTASSPPSSRAASASGSTSFLPKPSRRRLSSEKAPGPTSPGRWRAWPTARTSRALDLAQNEDLLADRQMVLSYFRLAYVGGGAAARGQAR